MHIERSDWAKILHEGSIIHGLIEEAVEELWPDLVAKIGSDYYDNSLEVYFLDGAPIDLVATEKEIKAIFDMGFGRFWLNFPDGTEQAVWKKGYGAEKDGIGERRQVNHPKWTAEDAKEYA